MINSVSEITANYQRELDAAQQRPRLNCSVCGKPAVLDFRFGPDTALQLCDDCILVREQWQQHRDKMRRFRESQRASGLPDEFHALSLKNYNPAAEPPSGAALTATVLAQRKTIHEFFSRFGTDRQPEHGAFITGPAGTGKTMLTAMLANRLLWHGYGVIWVNGYSLDRDISAEWKTTGKDQFLNRRLAEEIAAYDCVFIEDLQIPAPNPYPWYAGAITDIVNEISIRKRLLFVTTNHRRKAELIMENGKPMRGQNPDLYFERAYGEKFNSRIDSLCRRFPLAGPDMRPNPQ